MKLKYLVALLIALLVLAGCGKTKSVTCDACGKEIQLSADSNITDEWIVYCKDCELSLFGEDGVVSGD